MVNDYTTTARELGEGQQHIEGQPSLLVVVLNDWVTETSCLSNISTSLAKSASERVSRRPCRRRSPRSVSPGLRTSKLCSAGRTIEPPEIAAVVITLADPSPALARLALDVGLGAPPALRVEGIESPVRAPVGRDACVDGATQAASDRLILQSDASPADAHSLYGRRSYFCSFPYPRRRLLQKSFPGEAQRSDGRSTWSWSSPWRSGTGCRRFDPSSEAFVEDHDPLEPAVHSRTSSAPTFKRPLLAFDACAGRQERRRHPLPQSEGSFRSICRDRRTRRTEAGRLALSSVAGVKKFRLETCGGQRKARGRAGLLVKHPSWGDRPLSRAPTPQIVRFEPSLRSIPPPDR